MKYKIICFLFVLSSAVYAQEHPPVILKQIGIFVPNSSKEYPTANVKFYLNFNGTFKVIAIYPYQSNKPDTYKPEVRHGAYSIKGNIITFNYADGMKSSCIIKQMDEGITKMIAEDGTTYYYLRTVVKN
jgi:hypothetical protein